MINDLINILKNLRRENEFAGRKEVVLTISDISYLLNLAENTKKEIGIEKEKAYRANIQSAANETKITILEKEIEELRKENRAASEFYNVVTARLKDFSIKLEKSRNENERLKADIRSANNIDRDYAIKQVDDLIKKSGRSTDSWFYERLKEFILILPSTKDLKETVCCTNCEHYHPYGNETRCLYRDMCCPQNPESSISRSVRKCYSPKRKKEF